MYAQCLVCPAGKYTETTGSLNCTDCPAGKYLEDDGMNWKFHTLELLCALCPSGKSSSLLGASICQDCEIGKFSGGVGNTQCVSCTIGSGVARFYGGHRLRDLLLGQRAKRGCHRLQHVSCGKVWGWSDWCMQPAPWPGIHGLRDLRGIYEKVRNIFEIKRISGELCTYIYNYIYNIYYKRIIV